MKPPRLADHRRKYAGVKVSDLTRRTHEQRRGVRFLRVLALTQQALSNHISRKWPLLAKASSLVSCPNPRNRPRRLQDHRRHTPKAEQEKVVTAYSKGFLMPQVHSLAAAAVKWIMSAVRSSAKPPTQAWPMPLSQMEQRRWSFIYTVSQDFPTGDFENWTKCEQLLPHVEQLYHMDPTTIDPATVDLSRAWAQTLTNAAWYLWKTGRYSMAQHFLIKTLTVMELVLRPHDEQVLVSVDILAGVLSSQERYNEAEELHQQALRGFREELGLLHPSTLTSMSNLALVLQHQGKYRDAEELNRRALERSKKVLGACHVDTLTSASNLALVLQHQGKFEEAVELNLQALKGFQEQLGLQHPSTLTSISNLACVLQFQGNHRDSEELNWLVLQERFKELGIHHPSTQTTVRNLAWVLRA